MSSTPSPLRDLIPSWPPHQGAIQAELLAALDSGDWCRYESNAVEQLAKQIANDLGCEQVNLVASGTVGVELALRACRIGPGSQVILSAYDYPGNIRSVMETGAEPVTVDVLPGSVQMDIEQVEKSIQAETAAILVSHLYQCLANIKPLRQLANDREVLLIEDACQAPGALVDGRVAGTTGDVSIFSFGGSKLITAGTGGAVTTSDPRIAQRLRVLLHRPSPTLPLSGLQAATILPQWNDQQSWIKVRNDNAGRLASCLQELGVPTWPISPPNSSNRPAIYKFGWLADSESARDSQLAAAAEAGLPCGAGFPVLSKRRSMKRGCVAAANAQDIARRVVLLHHAALAVREEFDRVLSEIARIATMD